MAGVSCLKNWLYVSIFQKSLRHSFRQHEAYKFLLVLETFKIVIKKARYLGRESTQSTLAV